jgi:hypothetical protein
MVLWYGFSWEERWRLDFPWMINNRHLREVGLDFLFDDVVLGLWRVWIPGSSCRQRVGCGSSTSGRCLSYFSINIATLRPL